MANKPMTLLAGAVFLLGITYSCISQDLPVREGPRSIRGTLHVPNEVVVKFKAGVSEEEISQVNRRHGGIQLYKSPFAGFRRIKTPAGKSAKQLARLYELESSVEYAELNYYARAMYVPNDQYHGIQWNFKGITGGGINVQQAWDITTGSPEVVVAVVDTGVAFENHKGFTQAPDLANTLFVPGFNFAKPNEQGHANDDDGHGTHVAGTIAQSTNNTIGVAGIAFNCSIMPVKVLNRQGEAPYTTIADGVYFAADNGANVINMSLGGPSHTNTLRDAVAYAYGKGVTIVCAAGNEFQSGNPASYPAAYDDYCIAVGATRYDKQRAYYSNTGSYVDIVAPGGDVNVDQNGDGYGDGILQQTFGSNPGDMNYFFYQGTSMAAPHVSGVAALLISRGVTDPDMVREAIEATAVDLGPAGWDTEYGWGIIDAYAALNYCDITGDITGDCFVDLDDIVLLASYWLEDQPSIDIAPEGGDNIINLRDFAAILRDWMN